MLGNMKFISLANTRNKFPHIHVSHRGSLGLLELYVRENAQPIPEKEHVDKLVATALFSYNKLYNNIKLTACL